MAGDTLIALLACVIIAGTLGYSINEGIVVEGVYDKDTKMFAQGATADDAVADSESFGYFLNSSLDKTVAGATGTYELNSAPSTLSGSAFVFKMFPQTFASISKSVDSLGNVIGFAFYLAVFFAAMSSMISLLEPAIANFQGAHNINRAKGVVFVCFIQFLFGLPFVFQGGADLMDLTDGFFTGYLLLISAFIVGAMVVVSGQKTKDLTVLNNKSSMYKLGGWYRYSVGFGCLLILASFIAGLYANIDGGDFSS